METNITEVSPVERELEIHAPAREVDARLDETLRDQRKNLSLKGFRKGKAPMALIRKMAGSAVGREVAEKLVLETFEQEVVDAGEQDVMGRAEVTELDYEPGQDLRAVVRFAVQPQIELKDLSEEEITRLAHEVTDEEIDEEMQKLRRSHADLMPSDEPAGEASYVIFDLQELDAETGAPILGQKDEEQAIFLDGPQIAQHPMLSELKEALLGAQPGDTRRFSFTREAAHEAAHGEHEPAPAEAGGRAHAHRFEAVVHEVKERELPELDAELIEEATDGEFADVEVLRQEIRFQMERAWDARAEELMEGQITALMVELHPMPIPPAMVENYLDAFIEDVKRRNEGEMPEDFDETYFRSENRAEAERQVHWMLLRDQVIAQEDLEVTDADADAHLGEQAAFTDELTAEQLRQYYRTMPKFKEQVQQQILSRKVYKALERRFRVVDKDLETLEQELGLEENEAQAASPLVGEGEPQSSDAPSSIITGP